jgi:hypothetical protein
LKSSNELNELTYKHERLCADLYVALKLTGVDFLWYSADDQKKGFRFDRALKIFDKRFFFEVETGSAYSRRHENIPKKIDQYLTLEGRFHVIFVVCDYEGVTTAKQYATEISTILQRYNRGSQFLVAPHVGLAHSPLGNWLIHKSGEIFSLETLK